jgi:K+-transporting ATPase ATPase C chain
MPTEPLPPDRHRIVPATILGQLRPACSVLVVLAVITGVFYPLGMTLVTRSLFPRESSGSLLRAADGTVIGSLLISQPFTGPGWFHGRPSATGAIPSDPTASGGSNLGPTNAALAGSVAERVAAIRRDEPSYAGAIPVDLVTTSASGLDPHISPRAALLQVPRVAAARGLPVEKVQSLVTARIEPPLLGILGRPRVNVLALNLALDVLAAGGRGDAGGSPLPP